MKRIKWGSLINQVLAFHAFKNLTNDNLIRLVNSLLSKKPKTRMKRITKKIRVDNYWEGV
jgi:hypothetical protein